jgi:hypothetical protein
MESLFKRLFLYRSTEKRRAWEDWLTESFAAVLDHGISKPRSGGACKLPRPSGWKEPPQTWPESYVWVCEIGEQHLRGAPLSASYLEFFTGAFTALKAVL